jgi:DENN domain-containing protein 4
LKIENKEDIAIQEQTEKLSLNHNNNFNSTLYTDQPILFKGQRSATFDDSTQLNKTLHRSETMPTSVASSLASLGSTLKFSFG